MGQRSGGEKGKLCKSVDTDGSNILKPGTANHLEGDLLGRRKESNRVSDFFLVICRLPPSVRPSPRNERPHHQRRVLRSIRFFSELLTPLIGASARGRPYGLVRESCHSCQNKVRSRSRSDGLCTDRGAAPHFISAPSSCSLIHSDLCCRLRGALALPIVSWSP